MMIATQTGMKLNWRELQAEYLDMYGNEFFEDELTEDAVPYADIAAMATVAGVTWPIMKNMIKVAWKTGKGMYKITRIAQKAGVKLAKFSMGEENEKSKFVPNEQHSRRKSQAIHRYS